MPVDTHVHRLARRLDLIDAATTADQAHPLLTALAGPEQVYAAHIHLVIHGRRVCHARRPACGDCPLTGLCPSAFACRDSDCLTRPSQRQRDRNGENIDAVVFSPYPRVQTRSLTRSTAREPASEAEEGDRRP